MMARPRWCRCIPKGVNNPIPGLFGGLPGLGARGRVLDPSGQMLIDCGTGQLVELTHPHQRVEMVLAGGAGYGPPAERDAAAVSRDLALGLISPAHASQYYGHAVAAAIDEAAT